MDESAAFDWIYSLAECGEFPEFDRIENPEFTFFYTVKEGVTVTLVPSGFMLKKLDAWVSWEVPTSPGLELTPEMRWQTKMVSKSLEKSHGVSIDAINSPWGAYLRTTIILKRVTSVREFNEILNTLFMHVVAARGAFLEKFLD